jgi:hypothetical protein
MHTNITNSTEQSHSSKANNCSVFYKIPRLFTAPKSSIKNIFEAASSWNTDIDHEAAILKLLDSITNCPRAGGFGLDIGFIDHLRIVTTSITISRDYTLELQHTQNPLFTVRLSTDLLPGWRPFHTNLRVLSSQPDFQLSTELSSKLVRLKFFYCLVQLLLQRRVYRAVT